MPILLLLVGALLGGFISWIITHSYYKKSSVEQKAIFNKLSTEIKQTILKDKRDSLTVKELNELLEEKVIDRESKDTLPFKACPKCGSENIVSGEDAIVDYDVGDEGEPVPSPTLYGTVKCRDCGWEKTELDSYKGHI